MNAPTDAELLTAYAAQAEEQAFREFVQRHASWVLGVATRAAGNDASLGEEITQNVFCLAAKKAAGLASGKVVVAAWLHRTTLLSAANAVRTERRHRHRLEHATVQCNPPQAMNDDETTLYQEILPHLDGALDELPEGDRSLLLHRFFERQSIAGMARVTGISEAACQKRLSRAVQRLGAVLKQRKVAVSSVMLGSILATPLCKSAQAALVKSLADTALLAPAGKATVAAFAMAAPVAGVSLPQILAVAAALLAFATPVGLQLWENAKSPAARGSAARPATETVHSKKEAAPAEDPTLAALAAALRALKSDDPEGLLEVVLFVSGLPLESLPGAWDLLRGSAADVAVTRALFARWTELDLPGAVAATERADTNIAQRSLAWNGIGSIWAVRDPKAFFAKIAEDPAGNMWVPARSVPITWQQVAAWAGLTRLSLVKPAAALEFAATIPNEEMRLSVQKLALNLWGQRDPDGAVAHLKSSLSDQALDEAMHTMATQLAYHQPRLSVQISAQQMNPHLREEEFRFSFVQWAASDPKEAAAAMAALPAEMQASSIAQNAGRAVFWDAPEEATALAVNASAGEFREEMLFVGADYFLSEGESYDPRKAFDLAALMAPGKQRTFFYEHAAVNWLKANPAAARAWLEQATDLPADLKHKLLSQ